MPDRLCRVAEIGGDLVVRARGRRRGDHHAGGAYLHRRSRELTHRGKAGGGDADDDWQPRARYNLPGQRQRFLVRELRCLAHHAEDGDAVDAGLDIEIDHAVDAGEVDRTIFGKRRGGDDVDAGCRVIEHRFRLWLKYCFYAPRTE